MAVVLNKILFVVVIKWELLIQWLQNMVAVCTPRYSYIIRAFTLICLSDCP